MNWYDKLHMRHRFWRYRLHTEVDDLGFIRKHGLAGHLAVDIGANKGIYSYWLHQWVDPGGEVIAFEPQPELQEHLRDLKQAFALDRLTIVPYGLSDQPGKLPLFRPAVGSGSATVSPGRGAQDWTPVEVSLDTLDRMSADWGKVSFIKCDVEGHERSVFRGGRALLLRDHPTILFECAQADAAAGELFADLQGLGYVGFFVTTLGVHPLADFDKVPYSKPGIDQRNYFFCTPDLFREILKTARLVERR